MACMETLSEALERLEGRGFVDSFQPRPGGDLVHGGVTWFPESLVIDEIVRFEGTSDPAAELVLFALRSEDDATRGTLLASFGPQTDPDSAAAIERLSPRNRKPS